VGQTIFNTDTDEIQFWDGTSWVVPSSLGNLSDVDLAGLADGDFLQYDSATGNWLAVQLPPPIPFEDRDRIISMAVFI
jgi:hypothetical protein